MQLSKAECLALTCCGPRIPSCDVVAHSRCDVGGETENEEKDSSSSSVVMGSVRSFLCTGSDTLLSGALCRNSNSLSVGGGNLILFIKSPSSGLAPRDASAPEGKASSTSGLEGVEKCPSTCSLVSSVHWMGMENCCSADTYRKIHNTVKSRQNLFSFFVNVKIKH